MYDPALHLFIDDHYIRNIFAVRRIFGKPEKYPEPTLRDIPGRLACWGCVLQEADGRFRMWYQSVAKVSSHEMAKAGVWGRGAEYGFFPERMEGAIRETKTSVISYAESGNGFTWTRPELGLIEWNGNKRNNIVIDGEIAAKETQGRLTNMDSVSIIRDEDAPASERYKFISHWETVHDWDNIISKLVRPQEDIDRFLSARAKYLMTSPDGIHWKGPLVRIMECSGGGDYCGVTRNERKKTWWLNDRAPIGTCHTWKSSGLPDIWFRSAGLAESSDLYHWPSIVEQVFFPGEYEDYGVRYEHHGMTPFNYGDQDLCFLELSVGGGPVAALLGSHRDGQRWRLAGGHNPFLEVGPRGSYDDTAIAFTRNGPFRVNNKLLFYYNGRHYETETRDCSINIATLRLDGFAGFTVDKLALRRHNKPPFLQTQPIRVTEDELQINIEGHRGTARVALFHENLQPVPGCEFESCLPIDEDVVRFPVRWKKRKGISELKGTPVIAIVQLTSGTLYSLRF